ncbi:MAG: hypothetical protein HY303_20880 [Candidatus Wallbacteria bacterium]|nr:hypothetical protein [Candidatus Wallbacteria bacterium]
MSCELTPLRLLGLVMEEAFKDGEMSSEDDLLLGKLEKALRLPGGERVRLQQETEAKARAGRLGNARPFDRLRLFEKCLAQVFADGQVTDAEKKLVDLLGRLLEISKDEHRLCLATVRDKLKPLRRAPASSAEQPPSPPPAVVSHALPALAAAPEPAPPALDELLAVATAASKNWRQQSEVLPAVETALRLAKGAPGYEPAWVGLATVCHAAGKLLSQARAWNEHARVRAALEEIPARFAAATDPLMARFLADQVVFALDAGARNRAWPACEALRKLVAARPSEVTVAELANALSCLVDPEVPDPDGDYPRVAALLDELVRLSEAHPANREVARSLATASAGALISYQVAKDPPRLLAFAEALVRMAQRCKDDESLLFSIAKAVVNAAIVWDNYRKEAGLLKGWMSNLQQAFKGGSDPVLGALKSTLEALLALAPASSDLADARGRFERVTRVSLAAPGGAKPAPALPEDVLLLRKYFDQMQQQGPTPGAMKGILMLLGPGPYLPRAVREGEEVYAKDEPYFVQLLAELSRQVSTDRSGFWAMNAGMLEAMTRYLVEDATPRIAQAANELRRVLQMPAA